MKRLQLGLLVTALALAWGVPADAAAKPPAIRLDIRISVEGKAVKDYRLNCNPSTRSRHPTAKAACALLNKVGVAIFASTPKDAMCTMMYGGPQRALVTGSWGSKRIRATFSRENGCEIARWERAVALLTLPAWDPNLPSYSVSGRVSLGPTCPVQQEGQLCERPSVDAPVTFSFGSSEKVTVNATTSQGFSLRLHAGTWTVTARAGMRCPAITVTVPTDAEIVIPCDTGIR